MELKTLLTNNFNSSKPIDMQAQFQHFACVSIILQGNDLENLELGFIQRAHNPEDRWSGHLAFPGGRHESFDKSALDAAIRETREEIGVDLSPRELLGQLNDVQARRSGAHLDFFIRPFVFHINRTITTNLDPSEVADFFWVPVHELKKPTRQTKYQMQQGTQVLELPAVHLDRETPLWGLTYSMVLDLMNILK